MRLARRSEPFDSNDFIYELKIDGFRALAHVADGSVRIDFEEWKRLPWLCRAGDVDR